MDDTIIAESQNWNLNWISSLQDTAGQERYRTITTAYYRGAMGFILMYDITNEESFNSVQDWWEASNINWILLIIWINVFFFSTPPLRRVTQIKTYSWDNAQVILVGNKCDMEDERVISFERGKQLADQLGVEFFETSAKENVNVKVIFAIYIVWMFLVLKALDFLSCLFLFKVRFWALSRHNLWQNVRELRFRSQSSGWRTERATFNWSTASWTS